MGWDFQVLEGIYKKPKMEVVVFYLAHSLTPFDPPILPFLPIYSSII